MGKKILLDDKSMQKIASSLGGFFNCGILSDAERYRIYRIIILILAFLLEVDVEINDVAFFTPGEVVIS